MARKTFEYRMIYATSEELIQYGSKIGCNWAVVASTGHKSVKIPVEDPAVVMPKYEKLTPYRTALKTRITTNRVQIDKLIKVAKTAGMKAVYHAYEPSLPSGFQEAYPEMFVELGNPYLSNPPADVADQREVCVARPEVRAALAAKVEEICRTHDIDAYMFSNNECSTLGQVYHRCENCIDIPISQMMKYLHDAMAEGIRRSGRPVRLMNRCWGTHETEDRYHKSFRMRADFGEEELPEKAWLRRYAELHRPAKAHFSPKRDIPAYVKLIKGSDTIFVYKASWADTNLHHPLNPWMGKYEGHDEIIEFSFEHCVGGPQNFYIMGREMQRRARMARSKGVAGLCCVPVNWGRQDDMPVGCHPSKWSLNELNIFVYDALCKDPDADLMKVAQDYLRRRYSIDLPAELAALLLESEEIAADMMNVNGIRGTGTGLAGFYNDLLRYAFMYPDWRKRTNPTPANLKKIFAAKEANVGRAKAMLQQVEALRPRLPREAYEDFHARFQDLLDNAVHYANAHKLYMTLWAIKDGYLKPTLANLEAVCKYGSNVASLRKRKGDATH